MKAIAIILSTILSLVCIFAFESREVFVDISDPEIAVPVRVYGFGRAKRSIENDFRKMQDKKKASTLSKNLRKTLRAREKLEW